jgi:hypothetical protein
MRSRYSSSEVRTLCLLLAAGTPGMAQTAVLQLPGKPAATVEGRVMNSVTGEPVSRAHVLLEIVGQQTFGAVTDADGRFSIDGPAVDTTREVVWEYISSNRADIIHNATSSHGWRAADGRLAPSVRVKNS